MGLIQSTSGLRVHIKKVPNPRTMSLAGTKNCDLCLNARKTMKPKKQLRHSHVFLQLTPFLPFHGFSHSLVLLHVLPLLCPAVLLLSAVCSKCSHDLPIAVRIFFCQHHLHVGSCKLIDVTCTDFLDKLFIFQVVYVAIKTAFLTVKEV